MKFCNRSSGSRIGGSLVVLLALALPSCGTSSSNVDDRGAFGGPAGSIRGFVKLVGDLPAAASDKITQDQTTCGDSVSLPRIAVGQDNGVRDTFVFLEGVPNSGAPLQPTTRSVLMDQKGCQYVPHAMIVPVGSQIEVVNSDPILHNVHGKQNSTDGMRTAFNYGQPTQGLRSTVDPKNLKPGIVSLSCEAGHPWMSAFIYVAKDPYVALTGSNGEFLIQNVPPGKYTIKMWHEGVTLKQIHRTLQLYEYEEPYELAQEVVVEADKEAPITFELALRQQ